MVRNGVSPTISKILSVFIVLIFLSAVLALPVYAASTLKIPAGIHGVGHNGTNMSTIPDTMNGTGIVMKKVAIVNNHGSGSSAVPQCIVYGDGYFFVSHNNGYVDRIPEDRIINGSGGTANYDKSFRCEVAHGQGLAFYDGLLWCAQGNTLRGYDVDGHLQKTEHMSLHTDYFLAITDDGTVWNVSSGDNTGDRTNAHYAKFGTSSWSSIYMNHAANETQGSQGGDYNPATNRIAFITNGIIMTFPAQSNFKGSDVHMFPFGSIPESEGITFTQDGKGYALLRGMGSTTCSVMEVTLDDDMVNNDEKFDFAFYELASRASVEFQQAVLDGDAKDMLSDNSKTGCAATYLGYTKSTLGTLHSTSMRNTQNTIGYSYDSLADINDTVGSNSGFTAYVNYGRLLADLGYDEVGSNLTKTIRLFTGGLLICAYYLGLAVPMLSGFILDFLRAFNPFALLHIGTTKLASYGGSLEVFADQLRDIYDSLYNLSLFVMLPLMAALGVGMALLSGGRDAGKKSIKVILEFAGKVAIIILALPIVAAGYSHLLDSIEEMHVFGPESANQLVYSELVDFQGWVENTSLNPPEDLELKWGKDGAELPKQGIRRGARKINVLAGHKQAGVENDSRSRFSDGYKAGKSSGMEVTLGNYNYTQNDSFSKKIKDVQSLMTRYLHADVYSSAVYESQVKEEILKRVADGDVSIKSMILDGTSGAARPYSSTSGNLFGNGTISYTKSGGYKPGNVSGDRLTGDRGISTLGMFNYLTTEFESSQMLVYGAKTSNNERVKGAHMSVTAVGSGFYGAALYLQTVISLFCIGLIGIVYGFGFVAASFKRGFKTIAAIPGMMLGSREAIGRFVVAVVLLFAEILITIVLYAFFCELILVVNDSFVSIFVG